MALDNYSVNLPPMLISALEIPKPVQYWVEKCVWNLDRTIAIAIPVVVFRCIVDRQPGAFYGLTREGFDWKPYATMLLIMVPMIAWASFRPPVRLVMDTP